MGTENEALIMSRDEFSLRLVTVRLENGNSEILATNLSREQLPQGDFQEIYHMRWQIETAYETLKDRLQLENFTGTKAILSTYFWNQMQKRKGTSALLFEGLAHYANSIMYEK